MIQECIHCGRKFEANPRVKNQKYCRHKGCQRARRARWQRQKKSSDPDYRDNQRRCQEDWAKANRGYSRAYRSRHPEYVARNRLLQIIRNARQRKDRVSRMIAKMDSLGRGIPRRGEGLFRLEPQGGEVLAKMDSLTVKLIPVQALRGP